MNVWIFNFSTHSLWGTFKGQYTLFYPFLYPFIPCHTTLKPLIRRILQFFFIPTRQLKMSHDSKNSHLKDYFSIYFLSILTVLMVLKVFDITLTSLIFPKCILLQPILKFNVLRFINHIIVIVSFSLLSLLLFNSFLFLNLLFLLITYFNTQD